MNKLNILIVVVALVVATFCGLLIGGDQASQPESWETPNSNNTITKTVTNLKTLYTNLTVAKTVVEQHTVTANKTFYVTSTVTETQTTTQKFTFNKTVPAYENNDPYQIRMMLKHKLNVLRESRGLDRLSYSADLAYFAEVAKVPVNTSQIFTLTSYVLEREGHQCWRGDLYVAGWVADRIASEYDYVLYSGTTHGVGLYVEVGLYKIHVRAVFLGG